MADATPCVSRTVGLAPADPTTETDHHGIPVVRVVLFMFGILPLGIYTVIAAPMGFVIGVIALTSRQNVRLGALLTCWALAGGYGMLALACGAARFGRRDFVLRHWETIGIIAGLAACLPFFFFRLFPPWIYILLTATASCAIIVSVSGTNRG